ncbi:MAG TPA: Calx-beta domain-containing protein, partial [Solirubrobacterales bacterium]|nr:Calx-beta domain-containing protein [Solirubrobacterales bacterium]
LNSGTYVARNGSTFSFPGAAIRANSAEIALDGPGSAFENLDGTDALATLRTNGVNGSVRLRNDGNLAIGGDLFNNGEVDIDTESELTTAGDFTQGSSGSLSLEASGITPGDGYGRVVAGGAAELDGRLDLRADSPLDHGEFLDVVTSGSPRAGTFSEVSGDGFDVSYLLYRVRIKPPSLRAVNTTVSETDAGTTSAAVRVNLSTPSEAAVAVDYRSLNDTAGQPADYTFTSGRLNFPPGATSAFIQVPIKGDTLDEIHEDLIVQLDSSDPRFADVADDTARVTIQDNDPTPTISVANVPNRIEGGANFGFAVSLSAPSGRRVKLDYSTVDGTAVAPGDYTAKDSLPPAPDTAPIVFRAGETQKVVSIVNVDDAIDEPLETFYLRISDPMGASILDATGRTRIVDNDP